MTKLENANIVIEIIKDYDLLNNQTEIKIGKSEDINIYFNGEFTGDYLSDWDMENIKDINNDSISRNKKREAIKGIITNEGKLNYC